MSLIRIQNGALAFGHVPLLDAAELNILPRERLCLIGRNGTGKSTLLNVLAGEQLLDSGRLWYREGLKIAKLAQEVPDAESLSLFEVVAAGLGDHSALLARYHNATRALGDPQLSSESQQQSALEEFGTLQTEIETAGAWEGSQRIDAVLSRLVLTADALMSECSGGIRRRAMLGQALVSEPDLLLLDEPTNHLDIESIDALESALLGYPGTVLFITHDRTFIDHLATRIIELDRGILRSYPGSYASYLKYKSAQLEAEADADRKFDQALAQEEVWIRQGIKARRTRNEGRVRRLQALRTERAQRRSRPGAAKMNLASGQRSGKIVIEADRLSFSYNDQVIINNFSTRILRGDRIGIIGRNGSGKSTLLRLLLGELQPTSGTLTQGTQLKVAYFDQEREVLDPERSVRDNLGQGSDFVEIGGKRRHVIGYLNDFLFPPARAQSPVKTLSGGERNRLLLAKLFTQPANLLVLDEPTNDLDIETLELLEELLADYDGTLLLVSHDRSFLDRTVTSTLVLSDPAGGPTAAGHIEEHVGGYSDWLEYAQQRSTSRINTAAKQKPATAARIQTSQSTKDSQHRLSFAERQELERLPGLIETLEVRQTQLHKEVGAPEFYQRSREEIATQLQKLAELDAELQSAYARWEALEA